MVHLSSPEVVCQSVTRPHRVVLCALPEPDTGDDDPDAIYAVVTRPSRGMPVPTHDRKADGGRCRIFTFLRLLLRVSRATAHE